MEVGDFLKKLLKFYVMLFDLYGMDECLCIYCEGLFVVDFFVFYYLIFIDCNCDIMLKVVLVENDLYVLIFIKLFLNVNWYECEIWDLFGIIFDGYLNL